MKKNRANRKALSAHKVNVPDFRMLTVEELKVKMQFSPEYKVMDESPPCTNFSKQPDGAGAKRQYSSRIVEDPLTENRYWTFWSSDWTKRVYVYWGGKTKFSTIKKKMLKRLGANFGYERQVELKDPEIVFK